MLGILRGDDGVFQCHAVDVTTEQCLDKLLEVRSTFVELQTSKTSVGRSREEIVQFVEIGCLCLVGIPQLPWASQNCRPKKYVKNAAFTVLRVNAYRGYTIKATTLPKHAQVRVITMTAEVLTF